MAIETATPGNLIATSLPTLLNNSGQPWSANLQTFYRKKIVCGINSTIRCTSNPSPILKTCCNCKKQFDPLLNPPQACRFHTAHFGGETKRKFESVYTGGTMSTPDSGRVYQYWHCCGSEDPFGVGCTAAPHRSYDD